MAALVPATLLLARALRALQLGDDTATGIGMRVEQARGALLVAGTGLAAVAIVAAGPVLFVAFVAPPIARRLTRSSLAIVAAGLVGAVLVLAADLVGRQAFGDIDLPVGIVTAALGAPYLMWLLARANRVGGMG
jgi:iron complex transport system permease protein